MRFSISELLTGSNYVASFGRKGKVKLLSSWKERKIRQRTLVIKDDEKIEDSILKLSKTLFAKFIMGKS